MNIICCCWSRKVAENGIGAQRNKDDAKKNKNILLIKERRIEDQSFAIYRVYQVACKNVEQIDSLVISVKILSNDIEMEVGLPKCVNSEERKDCYKRNWYA